MKAIKIFAILAVVYIVIVAGFETFLGYSQPEAGNTMVITTTEPDGESFDRVVTQIRHDDKLYVAVNHWPRAWYRRALDNPAVQITMEGETKPYTAVEVEGDEYDQVDAARPLGPVIKLLTGFPPRRILRLDPVG